MSTSKKKPAAKSAAKKKTTAKPKGKDVLRSVPDKTTAEYSTKLIRVSGGKNSKSSTGSGSQKKKSIAQRTVAFKTANWRAAAPWLFILLFLLAAGFFKFCAVGYSFSALVCLCLAGIILFYTVMHRIRKKYPAFERVVTRIFTVILCIGLLVVGITEAVIIEASFGDPGEACDYMIVLGAGVHGNIPSLSLQNRIDAAYDYLTAHPDVTAVLSGGKGDGENLSEAQCMYDHLTAMGIDPARLWLEDQATSTWENLHFSLDLIEEKTGTRPTRIGVLSSEYHLYRASLFTKECGAEFIGIPAKTTKISLRINYFLREVAGVWHYILLGGQYNA